MQKRTAVIGSILSLIPFGQLLLFKTGMVFSMSVLMLNVSQKAHAETSSFYFDRGNRQMDQGDYYGAISDFIKAIKINPSEGAYYNRGISKYKLNDFTGAISDYTKAIEINPTKYKAYYNRGNAKTALKDHYGAISDYIKAIEINPKYEKAYINRGRSFYSIHDKGNACKDFKKAVFLGSTSTEEWLTSEGGSWCRNM